MYDAFPVVIRVYFAQQRWKEAGELLDSFNTHLDRPANIPGIAHLAFPAARGGSLHHGLPLTHIGRLRAEEARRKHTAGRDYHAQACACFCTPGICGLLCVRHLPHPTRARSPAPAGHRSLESGNRPGPGDFPGHREKTCQQSAGEAGSHQSHPGDRSGPYPLSALTRFLPTGRLPPGKSTPFGILLRTVFEYMPFLYFP
jgi:hypothetical protein